jgi:acetyl-CoA synthetase
VEHVVVHEVKHAVPRADAKFYEGRDVWWEDAVAGQPTEAEVEWVEADHPLFLLYTSGSTGARDC